MRTQRAITTKLNKEQNQADQYLKQHNESKVAHEKSAYLRAYNLACERIWMLKWVLKQK